MSQPIYCMRHYRMTHVDVIVDIYAHLHTALRTEGNMLDMSWRKLKTQSNLMHGGIFSSLGVIFKELLSFKTAKCLGGKSSNELIHSLSNSEFGLVPCCKKGLQYIRFLLIGRVNRAELSIFRIALFADTSENETLIPTRQILWTKDCPIDNSLMLRRSRSFAAFVTHSLPSPSDILRWKPCSWRHRTFCIWVTNNNACNKCTNVDKAKYLFEGFPLIYSKESGLIWS